MGCLCVYVHSWVDVCVWGGCLHVSICGWMCMYVSIVGWMCRDVCVHECMHEWGGVGGCL